jgi:Tol biopolymer transport system component
LTVEPLEDRCLPSTLQAVSVANPIQPPSDTAAGASGVPVLSADGRYLAFQSTAPNLVPGQTGSPFLQNIFLQDRTTGTITLVSHVLGSATAAPTSADTTSDFTRVGSEDPLISRDGRFILYNSSVGSQIYGGGPSVPSGGPILYDRLTGQNTLVSQDPEAFGVALSGDGRYVVTVSNGQTQINLYDRVTGTTTPIARSDVSNYASIADDGTVVYSDANNVHLYSPATQTHQLLTTYNGPMYGGGPVAVISGDGSAVAYATTGDGSVWNVYRYDVHLGITTLLSGAGGSASVGGNANSGGPGEGLVSISHDGRFVAFTSQATNLLPGQSGAAGNVFLYDAAASSLTLLSGVNNSPLAGAGGTSGLANLGVSSFRGPPSITLSDDGQLVAYISQAGNIDPGQAGPSGVTNVFLYNRATGQNTLVSGLGGSPTSTGVDSSGQPVLSGSGNLLAFASQVLTLQGGVFDANGVADVFTYTPGSPGATLVSRSAFVVAKHGGDSFATSVSADGRYTVFTSLATNLVASQITVNGQFNIFLYDNVTRTTTLVNHVPGHPDTTGDGGIPSRVADAAFQSPNDDPGRPSPFLHPVISADGNFIAFVSEDGNLVPGEQSQGPDLSYRYIYLYDRRADTIKLVHHAPGMPANPTDPSFFTSGTYAEPLISSDGRYVAYATVYAGIGLYDSVLDTTTPISFGLNASMSDDGRFITYEQADGDVYLFDQAGGSKTLVSHTYFTPTDLANGISSKPVLSHDGRFIAFVSENDTQVPGEVSDAFLRNVFLYEIATGTLRLVSGVNGSATVAGDDNSDSPTIGLDGSYVAFRSDASDLVPGQTGPVGNIFEFNLQAGTLTLVSHQAGAPTAGAGGSSEPVMDDDGHFVSYVSTAGDLIAGQSGTAGVRNVFVWQRQANASILASGQDGSPTATGNADSDAPLLTRHSFPGFSSKATNLVAGLGGTSVVYLNTLVQLVLSPNAVADGSTAGTVVGTVKLLTQLVGQFLPPAFTLPGGEADNALFSLAAGQDSGTLTIRFQASYAARQSYEVNVHVDFGLGDDFGALDVVVAAPPPLVAPLNPLPVAAEVFAQSREHYTQFVVRAYQQFLKRFPDPSGLNFWVSDMLAGVYTDERVESFFLCSVEYVTAHGGTGAAWVTGMYQDLLGRTPSTAEVNSWLSVLAGGTAATDVAYGFAASTEREMQRVTNNYWTYLGRKPRADEVGLWVNGFLHGLTNEGMVAGFVGSPEYYNLPAKGQGDAATWVRRAYLDVLFRAAADAEVQLWLKFLG